MKTLIILSYIFLSHSVFCQTEKSIPSLKELQKANGRLKIETYYPVDTTTYYSIRIYLDSNFQITNREIIDGKYFVNENVTEQWWEIARIPKRKPISAHLDSSEKTQKEFNYSIQYTRILNCRIKYQGIFYAYEYNIKNGFVTQKKVTNRKGTTIKSLSDYSGLYIEGNRTWPTHIIYRNGKVKRTNTEIYYDKTVCFVIWK